MKTNKNKRIIISLILVLILALAGLTACQSGNRNPLETNLADTTGIRLEQAKQIALANARLAAAQVTFTGTALKTVDGSEVYALQFETDSYSYDYDIAAENGSIIDTAKKAREGDYISADQARELALADAGLQQADVSFSKTKLDRDDEKVIYELEFSSQDYSYDYDIDATSGLVLEAEKKPRQATEVTGQEEGSEMIGEAQAKQIALDDAGLPEKAVTIKKTSQKKDDGREIYELEFYTDTHEYDYDLDAYSGMIISAEKEQRKPASTTTKTETGQAVTYIGEARAKEIALQDAGLRASAVTFKKVKLDKDSKGMMYEVEFYTSSYEYEYDIDATTGRIVEVEKELRKTATSTTKTEPGQTVAYIGEARAREIALQDAGLKASAVSFKKVKLDKDGKITIYEIEFYTSSHEYEYDIDATSGKIIKIEKEARKTPATTSTAKAASTTTKATTAASQETQKPATHISDAQAREIALKDAGFSQNQVSSLTVELKTKKDPAYYEVEFKADNYEYEYEIKASTGTILEMEKERLKKDTGASGTNYIGEARAKELAFKDAGLAAANVNFKEIELEVDSKKAVYELEFVSGNYEYDYEIDARTGDILEMEKELIGKR